MATLRTVPLTGSAADKQKYKEVSAYGECYT
jgi:hypothetical protein